MFSDSGQKGGRTEDAKLITGSGCYTDDIRVPGQAYAAFLRAPVGHAVIKAIDSEAASAMPGVLGIFTASDLARDGIGDIATEVVMPGKDGNPMAAHGIPVLARERVRYVGEAVAIVVAQTQAQALDAVEAIDFRYEELLAMSHVMLADADDATLIWPDTPRNVVLEWEHGEAEKVSEAFRRAAHVVDLRIDMTRVAPTALEPRAAIGSWNKDDGRYTLIAGTQGVSVVRKILANSVFKVPPEQIRVQTFDVGGGFGMKVQTYAEYAALLYAARRVERPVRWCATRLESFLTDTHGRDGLVDGKLALDADGTFLGLRMETRVGIGAYISTYAAIVATNNTKNCLSSVYKIPAIHIDVRVLFTNATPIGPYRGAGRPEAIYLVERLIDEAARVTGIDKATLRRKNLIPASAMPYLAPSGQIYDSGEFEAVLDKALAHADWAGFAARREEARARGHLRGIGIGCFLEVAGGAPLTETVDLRVDSENGVVLRTGAQAMGQGQMTTLPLILSRLLDIAPDEIRVIQGDTDQVPDGIATVASRSTSMVGGAISLAVEELLQKGVRLAADALEASVQDIEYRAGRFGIVGSDRSIGLCELAGQTQKLDTVATFAAPEMSFPNGCHVCEVEIDPETGLVAVKAYVAVDDVGNIMHAVIVEGQVHGGVAQGMGQVLGEHVVYSDEGQLLTSSLMDYPVLRADHFPPLQLDHHVVPCTTNPLGVKGAGESGVAGSIPAVANAIIDALAERGVHHLNFPMSPSRIWDALQRQ